MGHRAPRIYSESFKTTSFSPANLTTYFFGTNASTSGTYSNVQLKIPRNGCIRGVCLDIGASTVGTDEAWPFYIRLNDSTDYLIETVTTHEGQTRHLHNFNLNIPVLENDTFVLKTVTPNWVTSPLIAYLLCNFFVESD